MPAAPGSIQGCCGAPASNAWWPSQLATIEQPLSSSGDSGSRWQAGPVSCSEGCMGRWPFIGQLAPHTTAAGAAWHCGVRARAPDSTACHGNVASASRIARVRRIGRGVTT